MTKASNVHYDILGELSDDRNLGEKGDPKLNLWHSVS